MKLPVFPNNDHERVNELLQLDILDTPSEEEFEDIVFMASSVTGCPISLISLVDHKRQWFKARIGLNAAETDRDISFCGHAITAPGDGLFEVQDTTADERFADNPLVTGNPNIRFYAGQPLVTSNGYKLGTLCVIDRQSRTLTMSQKKQMEILSKQAIRLIEARHKAKHEENEKISQTQFLAAMAHEIRTPLTSITGYTEVIKKEFGELLNTTKAKDYFASLENSSHHLLNLVGDILDLTKIKSKSFQKTDSIVSIRDLLRQITSVFRLKAAQKNIQFDIEINDKVPSHVKTDETLLKQILVNLISNAIKFTERGSVTVTTDYLLLSSQLQFSIKDTGMGMTASDIENAFKPFQRTALSQSKKIEGTGLGLSICKGLADLLEGEVKLVSSVVGEGTLFRLQIPAPRAESHEVDKASLKVQLDSEFFTNLSNIKNILLIEDSEDNRFIFTYFLKAFELDIDEAETGAQGLEKAAKNQYDAVFVDMRLPDIHGMELFAQLKELESVQGARLVAFTASSTAEEKARCMKAGFTHFLPKPFSRNDLLRSLTE
ncbi:MAG: response regulator [Bdellovibrionales bacterium]|nr:response regulator [Bdellovibrionales bacterium]